jgi:hypothetical protein
MKTSLVIIGLVVVIVIAAGAYYTLSINSRLSSSNHPNIPVVSSLTTQKTTAYTTSIQPKSTSSSSSISTTTVAQSNAINNITIAKQPEQLQRRIHGRMLQAAQSLWAIPHKRHRLHALLLSAGDKANSGPQQLATERMRIRIGRRSTQQRLKASRQRSVHPASTR